MLGYIVAGVLSIVLFEANKDAVKRCIKNHADRISKMFDPVNTSKSKSVADKHIVYERRFGNYVHNAVRRVAITIDRYDCDECVDMGSFEKTLPDGIAVIYKIEDHETFLKHIWNIYVANEELMNCVPDVLATIKQRAKSKGD